MKTIEQFCSDFPWYYPLKFTYGQLILIAVYNPAIKRVRICKPEYSFTGEFLGYTFDTIRKAYHNKSTNTITILFHGKPFTNK